VNSSPTTSDRCRPHGGSGGRCSIQPVVLAMARIALGESAGASRMGQGHIEHDWRVSLPMKDRYAGDPLCVQRGCGARLWPPGPRGVVIFCCPERWPIFASAASARAPAIRFQVIAADGPGRTIHCVRLPSTGKAVGTQWTISCADNADGADGLFDTQSVQELLERLTFPLVALALAVTLLPRGGQGVGCIKTRRRNRDRTNISPPGRENS
jgi:hypothetical protein